MLILLTFFAIFVPLKKTVGCRLQDTAKAHNGAGRNLFCAPVHKVKKIDVLRQRCRVGPQFGANLRPFLHLDGAVEFFKQCLDYFHFYVFLWAVGGDVPAAARGYLLEKLVVYFLSSSETVTAFALEHSKIPPFRFHSLQNVSLSLSLSMYAALIASNCDAVGKNPVLSVNSCCVILIVFLCVSILFNFDATKLH